MARFALALLALGALLSCGAVPASPPPATTPPVPPGAGRPQGTLSERDFQLVLAVESAVREARAPIVPRAARVYPVEGERQARLLGHDVEAYRRARRRIDEVALVPIVRAGRESRRHFLEAQLRSLDGERARATTAEEKARIDELAHELERALGRLREATAAEAEDGTDADLALLRTHAAELGLTLAPALAPPDAAPTPTDPEEPPETGPAPGNGAAPLLEAGAPPDKP